MSHICKFSVLEKAIRNCMIRDKTNSLWKEKKENRCYIYGTPSLCCASLDPSLWEAFLLLLDLPYQWAEEGSFAAASAVWRFYSSWYQMALAVRKVIWVFGLILVGRGSGEQARCDLSYQTHDDTRGAIPPLGCACYVLPAKSVGGKPAECWKERCILLTQNIHRVLLPCIPYAMLLEFW